MTTNYEKNLDITGIENEIAIFENFRITAMELGLGQAESQLRQGVVVRQMAIGKLKGDRYHACSEPGTNPGLRQGKIK